MRIEKISDNQLKIMLSNVDMAEYNIELSDVINCTDKARSLLYELIEKAQLEFSFEITGEPLAIEVTPAGIDGYMLIVTRVSQTDGAPVIQDTFSLLAELARIAADTRRTVKRRSVPKQRSIPKQEKEETVVVFSFATIDDVTRACDRLYDVFAGESMLSKMRGNYYLLLNNTQVHNRPTLKMLESLLTEYGEKQPSSELSEFYFAEHGEVILPRYATVKLAGLQP